MRALALLAVSINESEVQGLAILPSGLASTVQPCGALNEDGTREHVFFASTFRGADPCGRMIS